MTPDSTISVRTYASRRRLGSQLASQVQSIFDIGRHWPSSPGLLASVATTALFAGIYLKDLFAAALSPLIAPALLALGVGLGMATLLLAGRGTRSAPLVWLWLLPVSAAWVLTCVATGQLNTSSYYFALPLSLLVLHLNARLFMRLLAAVFLASLLVQLVEYVTRDYLFVFVDREGEELDAELFGGSLGVLRAKGLTQGPLSAVALGLWIAFLCARNVPAAALLLCCAFLASGRLGMTIGLLLLTYRLLFGSQMSWALRLVALTASVGLLVAAQFLLMMDDAQLEFISSTFDTSNDQTQSRFAFWIASIELYLSYDIIHLLVGNYGVVLKELGGTENDLLRMLLDNGVIGFAPFLVATLALIYRGLREKDCESLFVAFLIVAASLIFPFLQSLPSALLFWIYFFSKTIKPAPLRTRRATSLVLNKAEANMMPSS